MYDENEYLRRMYIFGHSDKDGHVSCTKAVVYVERFVKTNDDDNDNTVYRVCWTVSRKQTGPLSEINDPIHWFDQWGPWDREATEVQESGEFASGRDYFDGYTYVWDREVAMEAAVRKVAEIVSAYSDPETWLREDTEPWLRDDGMVCPGDIYEYLGKYR